MIRHTVAVTTAAEVRALVTRDRMKAELGIEGTASDSLLDDKILDASAAVETYCNRIFARQSYSEELRIFTDPGSRVARRGDALIQLQEFPISAPASASGIVLTVTENGTVLVQGTDYTIDYAIGEITRLNSNGDPCWWPHGTIVVAYTAGYALPGETGRDLPRDIEAATLSFVKSSYLARRRDPAVKQESVPGVYEAQYWVGSIGDSALPPDAEGILARYVRAAIG